MATSTDQRFAGVLGREWRLFYNLLRNAVIRMVLAITVLPLPGTAGAREARPVVGAYERFHAVGSEVSLPAEAGLLLLNELNCVACHAAPAAWQERLPGRSRISLTGVGDRLAEDFLMAWLLAPPEVKPGTTMPVLLPAGDAVAARALAGYLASLRTGTPPHFPAGDAARGRRLYSTIGCVACHASAGAESPHRPVPLALGAAYPREALAAFLQDPLATRPDGRMPAFELSDAEAADLAAFLQADAGVSINRTHPDGPDAARGPGASPLRDGHAAYAALNCAACHDDGAGTAPRAERPLSELRDGHGCLAPGAAAGAPEFGLDEPQRRALGAAFATVQAHPEPPSLPADGRAGERLAQLNCYACHERRGRGGIEPGLARELAARTSGVDSLGELGYLPPPLDGAGRKLTPEWLEKLLNGAGGAVRPYLKIRMPRSGKTAEDLIALLAEADRPAQPFAIDTVGGRGHQRAETGRVLLGTGEGGLGCVACHGLRDRPSTGVPALSLTATAQRLQPEYFKALLLDPQGTQPGTLMPSLLAGRKTASREVESLWTYFKELDGSLRLPEGLEPADTFELKPEQEGSPIVFRGFITGAGVQAIGVGHPAGVHVAFDALEVRWALAWEGRFLDVLSHWEERAMPPVTPLGEIRRTFPAHQALARLRAPTDPWPESWGRAAGYSFLGYRVGTDGIPVFRYAVGGITVEDVLRPQAPNRLLRVVTLQVAGEPAAGWFFRGLAVEQAPRAVEWRNGQARFEEIVTW